MIVAAPFFYLLGGSTSVMSTNNLAVVADIASDDISRYDITSNRDSGAMRLIYGRTKLFGYISSAMQIMQLLSPALAGFTLEYNLWIPFWIGIAAFALALPAAAFLPDTRRSSKESRRGIDVDAETHHPLETETLLPQTSEEANGHDGALKIQEEEHMTFLEAMCAAKSQTQKEFRDMIKLFGSNKNVGLCLVAFLVTTLAKSSLNILLLYISKRYDWTIARAAYLFSVKAAVNLLLFAAIIPVTLNFINSRGICSKVGANLWGARISLSLLGIGSLAIGLSPEIWVLIISTLQSFFPD